ncbi:PREDICTED: TELO2-interacting protein 2-like isoform X1 [Amphimedon queenslandica]|nr:PREDICTED: TELO2-interacting protein 2-like isoform X1 [Amphimedon queenslandica]|eukprot:XP_019855386.1 PREDICTED: TELO2-interacting protein 2-like isoform X1 [Amphimedon queenslandica]
MSHTQSTLQLAMNTEERDHKIKELIQKLKVKADSHKGKEDDVDYSSSLTTLNELIISINNKSELVGLVPVILTGVIPHTTRHYWTNESSILAAKNILTYILKKCHCSSIPDLLIGRKNKSVPGVGVVSPYTPARPTEEVLPWLQEEDEVPVVEDEEELLIGGGVMNELLRILRRRLVETEWKEHPNEKHTLMWCLRHLKHPHLSEYFNSFLPLLLLLIDDYEIYHKQLGLTGLCHLIANTDSAELVQYGKADLIYDSIKKLLYFNKVDIINALHPALQSLLVIMEGPQPMEISQPRKWRKTDEVFVILLQSMYTESKLSIRKAYIKHVCRYIECLGVFIIKYINKLLLIIFDYIEYPDYCGEETRKTSLTTLLTLMRYSWPRIPNHFEPILKSLIKLISDLCPDKSVIPDDSNTQDVLGLIIDCLKVLNCCCHENSSASYKMLLKDTEHAALRHCIAEALDTV